MSKIVETQTEYVCLNANPATTPNASVVAHYSTNRATSISQSYGIVRGLGYNSTSMLALETVRGVPVSANWRVYNTMANNALAVFINSFAAAPYTNASSMYFTVAPQGVLSIPASWRATQVQVGQSNAPMSGVADSAPLATPTNCVIAWWL